MISTEYLVQIYVGKQVKKCSLPSDSPYPRLMKFLSDTYPEITKWHVFYNDDEGDKITVSSNAELQEAFEIAENCNIRLRAEADIDSLITRHNEYDSKTAAKGPSTRRSDPLGSLMLDIHTHVDPPLPNLKGKYGGYFPWPETSPKMQIHSCGGDIVEDLSKLDEREVTVQVLSANQQLYLYGANPADVIEIHRSVNDDIAAQVQTNPRRYIGVGMVPLQSPTLAIEEMRRCVLELGLAGIVIGTYVNEWNLDNPNLAPIWSEAQQLGACILVHSEIDGALHGLPSLRPHMMFQTVSMGAEYGRCITAMMLGGTFERFPDLRWCFCHGGGTMSQIFGRVERLLDKEGDPRKPRKYLGQFWFDSLTNDPDTLDFIMKWCGEDKVALGSDFPFGWDDPVGSMVDGMHNWTNARRHKVLWSNGFEWLGLNGDDYIPDDMMEEYKTLTIK